MRESFTVTFAAFLHAGARAGIGCGVTTAARSRMRVAAVVGGVGVGVGVGVGDGACGGWSSPPPGGAWIGGQPSEVEAGDVRAAIVERRLGIAVCVLATRRRIARIAEPVAVGVGLGGVGGDRAVVLGVAHPVAVDVRAAVELPGLIAAVVVEVVRKPS